MWLLFLCSGREGCVVVWGFDCSVTVRQLQDWARLCVWWHAERGLSVCLSVRLAGWPAGCLSQWVLCLNSVPAAAMT
jgi:hypothetical protein